MQYAAPGNPGALRLATADEAAKAQRIETLCLREHAAWTCTRCGPEALYTPTTQSKLEEHLQAVSVYRLFRLYAETYLTQTFQAWYCVNGDPG